MRVTWLIQSKRLIHTCDMTHLDVPLIWHHVVTWLTHSYHDCDAVKYVTLLTHLCDVPYSYGQHDLFRRSFESQSSCRVRRSHMCDMNHSFTFATWIVQTRIWVDTPLSCVTYSCTWQYLLVRITWLIQMCDMAHSYVTYRCAFESPTRFLWVPFLWHRCDNVSSICVTWLTHAYAKARWYMRRDPSRCVLWLPSVSSQIRYATDIWMSHVSNMNQSQHTYKSRDSYESVTEVT